MRDPDAFCKVLTAALCKVVFVDWGSPADGRRFSNILKHVSRLRRLVISGDRIKLVGSDTSSYALAHSSEISGNTLITLNDGSTILLVGVSSINHNFFS